MLSIISGLKLYGLEIFIMMAIKLTGNQTSLNSLNRKKIFINMLRAWKLKGVEICQSHP